MMLGIRTTGAVMCASLLLASGCSDLEPDSPSRARNENWSSVILHSVSKAEAFDASQYAMKQWFRLDSVSPTDGQIRSVTMEYDQRGGTERIRDVALKYKNRMRRTASLVVQELGPDTVVRCIVRVQRLDTADQRVISESQQYMDYPHQTPIDRGAGATASQDQVWTDMPRDIQLERDILSVIKERTRKTPASAPAP